MFNLSKYLSTSSLGYGWQSRNKNHLVGCYLIKSPPTWPITRKCCTCCNLPPLTSSLPKSPPHRGVEPTLAKIGSLQLADQKPHIQSLNAAHSASLTSTKPGWTCSPLVRQQPGQAGRQQRATFRPQLTARQRLSPPLILSCRRDSHIGLPTCEHCTMRKFIHLSFFN